VALAVAAPAPDAMSRIRAVVVMLSIVALRVLPAQDRPVRATPAADLAREMITTPNERVAARWSSRGRALYDSSRYRESIASFELALKFGAGHPGDEAWNIARAYARLGNRKQALRWLSHALDMGCSRCDAVREDPRYREITEPSWKLKARQPPQKTL
jgi:tetratricopeptide (TPR) repeat protein